MRVPITVVPAGFALGAMLLQASPVLPGALWTVALFASALGLAATSAGLAHLARHPAEGGSAHAAMSARAAMSTRAAATIAACLAAVLAGLGYAALRAEHRLADALPRAWENQDIRLRGIVDSLPVRSTDATRFAFAVEDVLTPHAAVPRRVSLTWPAPESRGRTGTADKRSAGVPPEVHAGERWTLTVRLKRPHGTVNPHGFDLEAWLLERDLRATGYVRAAPPPFRVTAFAARPTDVIEAAREAIRTRIVATLGNTDDAAVLVALAIGDQGAISDAQWQVFNRTGVTHLISISGLHVTVFAALAGFAILVVVRRSSPLTSRVPARKLAILAGTLAASAYVLLAGAEIPAVRTVLMLAVAAAGLWLNRPGTAAIVWLWSLAAVVAFDPWASLAPGFWLSFGAVAVLLYACGARLRVVAAPGLRARMHAALREGARAQWVVTVALVPGTLAWFQQVSLVAPLANAVAIPVVTFAVVPLALAGIVVPLDLPWQIAQALLHLTLVWLALLSASPGAVFASHAPPAWTIAAAVAGALWIVAPRGVPGRLFGSALMLPIVLIAPPVPPPGGVRVVVLDVGQGLAALITTTKHALLYDAGPLYRNGDAGSRIVVPFLRAAGIARLDRLIVSHADTDHSGGVASVLGALPVASVTSSMDDPAPSGASTPRWTRCVAGERWEWDGVGFEILHPAASAYDDAKRKTNDLSCVLAVTSGAGRVLLTADIEARSEKEILARHADRLAADVLVVPHHGSLTSSTAAFIAAVAPRIAAVTAGYLNHFGHPRPGVLARYRSAGISVVRTDLDGALVFDLAPASGIATTLERERRRRYWFNRRSGRSARRSRRRVVFATASRVRNWRTDSRSRGRRRARSVFARREWSSGPAAAARTRNRHSRWSRRR